MTQILIHWFFPFILFQIFSSFLGNVFFGPSVIYKSVCLFSKYLKIYRIFSCLWLTELQGGQKTYLTCFSPFKLIEIYFMAQITYHSDISMSTWEQCVFYCFWVWCLQMSIRLSCCKVLFKSSMYLIDFYFATLINKKDFIISNFRLVHFSFWVVIWSFV